MNRVLFAVADFLSRPPGFYVVLIAMVVCTVIVPLGLTDVVTYALSVLAIVITGVVLIQGYRDTAAIHAKLDEIVIALRETRNDVVGLEHAEPEEIKEVVKTLEQEAEELADARDRLAAQLGPTVSLRSVSTIISSIIWMKHGSGYDRVGRPVGKALKLRPAQMMIVLGRVRGDLPCRPWLRFAHLAHAMNSPRR